MKRDIDFPMLIDRLNEIGITQEQIANEIGMKAPEISAIKQELRELPKGWMQGIWMLDIYLGYFDRTTVPRIGDYSSRLAGEN